MKNAEIISEISAPKILEELIQRAERARASDIHIQRTGGTAHISFRLDGVMTAVTELNDELAERVFGRIKFLARLKTYQESLPQDGRIEKAEINAQNDIRVSTYPTVTGEKIVLRLFATEDTKTLAELEFSPEIISELEKFLRQNSGLLLLTGPAGSGKTTTIYACLRFLADMSGRHVITIEDPVEQIIPRIMQTEISEARGLTFAKAARHLLRQDPQVLVIGEIRDDETANLAVRASLTGHLVISTLHAGSCKGVLERLFVMCSERYAVVSALALVLNQRLVRRLCPSCGGTGCSDCFESGYRGRIPIAEWILIDEKMRGELRAKGCEAIQPIQTLETSAKILLEKKVTNNTEYKRLFGG